LPTAAATSSCVLIFSAFPLSAPELAEQARRSSRGRSSLESRCPGAYSSLSEAFAKAIGAAVGPAGRAHPFMPSLIVYPSMYSTSSGFRGRRQGTQRPRLDRNRVWEDESCSSLPDTLTSSWRQRDPLQPGQGLTAVPSYPTGTPSPKPIDHAGYARRGTGINLRAVVCTYNRQESASPWTASTVPGDRLPRCPPQARRDAAQAL